MKKNCEPEIDQFRFIFKKALFAMKLTAVIFLISTFSLLAVGTYSQDTRISLNLKNVQIKEVLQKIESNTEYFFIYNNQFVDVDKAVSITAENQKVIDVLTKLFIDQEVEFQVTDRKIVIAPSFLDNQQQQKTVSGKVTDSSGSSLPGVSVVVKGTTTGTITDANGNYSLSNITENTILQFSFVGMKGQEISVGNKTTINVDMVEESIGIEEVVAIGYGTAKKSDLTGAVASVTAANLKERAVTSFGEALIGQVAGVQIQQINGAPGGEGLSIRVRGTGSITQSNEPLYVVDGYPMEGGAFRLLNPSDIESIQVLKDASSTAIYGSRGANGVVIINTKKGKSGAPSINFNMFAGVQQREKTVDMMNRDQYVEWFKDGRNQAWLDAPIISADPNKSPHSINDPNSRRRLYPSVMSTII